MLALHHVTAPIDSILFWCHAAFLNEQPGYWGSPNIWWCHACLAYYSDLSRYVIGWLSRRCNISRWTSDTTKFAFWHQHWLYIDISVNIIWICGLIIVCSHITERHLVFIRPPNTCIHIFLLPAAFYLFFLISDTFCFFSPSPFPLLTSHWPR